MSVEVSTYRLTLRGNTIGTNVVWTQTQNQTTNLKSRLSLNGRLGRSIIRQHSSCHTNRFFSYSFFETTEKDGNKQLYEVVFDLPSGLVTANRGQNDKATIPYLVPYRDPLSILFEIRNWYNPDGHPRKVPLLGKEVKVIPKGTTKLKTYSGEKTAWVYSLHPGNSRVYVGTEKPHLILHLTQQMTDLNIESSLSKVEEITKMPRDLLAGNNNTRRDKRRRKRRRKPRK